MYKKIIDKLRQLNKNQVLIGVAVLAIALTGILVFARPNLGSANTLSFLKFNSGNADAIAKKAVEYLNTSVLQQGQSASLISASEDSGVIKFKIDIQGKQYDSYVTKNGKLLFPEGIAVGAPLPNPPQAQDAQNPPNTPPPAQ